MTPPRPLSVAVSLALVAPLLLLATPARAATAAKPYDLNGDGYPELVVAAPDLTVGTLLGAGGVLVLPASSRGVASRGAQMLTAATPGVIGAPRELEAFGTAFASGDFDGDGFADLAVGRPFNGDGGALTIVYGSAEGLTGARSQELVEPGVGHTYGSFATVMAAGDLDGDGRADLAVGLPYSRVEAGGTGFGQVALYRSGPGGLSQSRSSLLHGRTGAPGAESGYDLYFGTTLSMGDLDSDGRTDLVVGSQGASANGGGEGYPGSVDACYGTAGGPPTCAQLTFDPALRSTRAMAVGNFSGSARPEIALGVAPNDDPSGGFVEVLSLTGTRADTRVSRVELTEDSPGVVGTTSPMDDFGEDVVLGDLDRDGYADLVVGAPGEDDGEGRVIVVYGGSTGYRTTGGRVYAQGVDGVPGRAEERDRFGSAIALLDHDRDGYLDLTVGARGENARTGAITVVDGSGSGTGLTTQGSRTIGLGSLPYPTTPDGASFGASLGQPS